MYASRGEAPRSVALACARRPHRRTEPCQVAGAVGGGGGCGRRRPICNWLKGFCRVAVGAHVQQLVRARMACCSRRYAAIVWWAKVRGVRQAGSRWEGGAGCVGAASPVRVAAQWARRGVVWVGCSVGRGVQRNTCPPCRTAVFGTRSGRSAAAAAMETHMTCQRLMPVQHHYPLAPLLAPTHRSVAQFGGLVRQKEWVGRRVVVGFCYRTQYVVLVSCSGPYLHNGESCDLSVSV